MAKVLASALRWIRAHRRPVILLLIALSLPMVAYEGWRHSVESEIRTRIQFLNDTDGTCAYVISNVRVTRVFEGKAEFQEGGEIHKTRVSHWSLVLYSFLLETKSSQSCKIWFGLTRTLFILQLNHTETPERLQVFDFVYAEYAPV